MKTLTSIIGLYLVCTIQLIGQSTFTANDLLNIKTCNLIGVKPDGSELIYEVKTPRNANETPGGTRTTYHKIAIESKQTTRLFGNTKVSTPQWSPNGMYIAFLKKSSNGTKQIWVMPSSGGKMQQVSNTKLIISAFKWKPNGTGFSFLAKEPLTEKELELKRRGYDFVFYEENIKNSNLYSMEFSANAPISEAVQLTKDIQVWNFVFNKKGNKIAFSTSEKNLIDQKYMFRKIWVVDATSGDIILKVNNVGKLGNYEFSSDDKNLAYTGALNINDHAVSQIYTVSLSDGKISNHTPKGFKGHLEWATWNNNESLIVLSNEGMYPNYSIFYLDNRERTILFDSKKLGVGFEKLIRDNKNNSYYFAGSSRTDPYNIYSWKPKRGLLKLTDINPEVKLHTLGKQEVFRYPARDGAVIEGLLIKPVGFRSGQKYPLIIYVHGGPESHHTNSWVSRYSTPGQVMANKGYMVAYLNYRASTGYGVDFAMEGFMDPAGKEFDDIADAIEHLSSERGADAKRVGLAGGSYGGYASAWFATYYTKYVKAVCMFVGISNLISKRGTTDIPYEEMHVHSGKPLEEQWEMNLKRSPIYWAHQSKTATLIYGGANDTRVHPSQSIELYRRMKMNDHPAVRLVQYPGEGHGNKKQVGRIDLIYRQMAWFDWYVKELNPIDGPMPPLDISNSYGLDWRF